MMTVVVMSVPEARQVHRKTLDAHAVAVAVPLQASRHTMIELIA